MSDVMVAFNVGWIWSAALAILIFYRTSKYRGETEMKTCPTCRGEAKVKDEVKDYWAEFRPRLSRAWALIWRGCAVGIITPATTGFLIVLTRMTLIVINAPLVVRDFRTSEMGPNGWLEGAAFLGLFTGLIFSMISAANLDWKAK